MPFQKFSIFAFSCISLLIISACNPLTVQPKQTETSVNNPDDILNLLDPDITTEEQSFAKGETALSQGKPDNALFYYVKTLQFNNKNIKALERIAGIHKRGKHPELAIKINKDILAIDNRNLLANENIGLYLLENGQPGRAKEHLTVVVQNSKGSWKAHNGLGVIADLAHNTDEAIAHYEAALAIEPTNPMLLNNLGYSYYLAGNTVKAKHLFNQALNFNNKYDRAIHNLALMYIKEGNVSHAAALFNRIMPVHESFNNIGYISMINGQFSIADEYLRRAIDESPVYFPKAQENLKTLLTLQSKRVPYETPTNNPSPPAPAEQPAITLNPAPPRINNIPIKAPEKKLTSVKEPLKKKPDGQSLANKPKAKPPSNIKADKPPVKKTQIAAKVNKISISKPEKAKISLNKPEIDTAKAAVQSATTGKADDTKQSSAKPQAVAEKSKSIDAPTEPAATVPEPKAELAAPIIPVKQSESHQPVMPIKKAAPNPYLKSKKPDSKHKVLTDILPALAPANPAKNGNKYITDIVEQ